MTIQSEIRRPIGTMVVCGFAPGDLQGDLAIAHRLGAEVVEVLPNWKASPDPASVRSAVEGAGLVVHSAHGCWGSRGILAPRVDLADPATSRASVDDLRRCVDWLRSAGGSCLVVHPGGLSDSADYQARRATLALGLLALADHAEGSGVTVCVENMPPGVHPGSRMADLADLVAGLDRPEIALALDTGHAHIAEDVASATIAAGRWLGTTHVHDNDTRRDSHLPPGLGSVDWGGWVAALDAIGNRGPILLECIRHLRDRPESLDDALIDRLRRMAGMVRS